MIRDALLPCVICLKSGSKYGPAYVNSLYRAVSRHLTVAHQFLCMTDDPTGLDCATIPVPHDLPGWWGKIGLFHPGWRQRLLFLDLDTVILGNIDFMVQVDAPFVAFRPPWRKIGLMSSVMSIAPGYRRDLWHDFIADADAARERCRREADPDWNHGDQRWLELNGVDPVFWQDVAPGRLISWKAEGRKGLPDEARVVVFHGHPRPIEVDHPRIKAALTQPIPERWVADQGWQRQAQRDARLADPDLAMRRLQRLVLRWRKTMLAHDIARQLGGPIVASGPFAGLVYPAEHEHAAQILAGVYEAELHDIWTGILQDGAAGRWPEIVDAGVSSGYYAAGLARKLPNTPIIGYEMNPARRALAHKTCLANDVAARVTLRGHFGAESLAQLTPGSLLIMDIEGGEAELLNPQHSPALHDLDILVEVHDVFHPGLSETLRHRFEATHDVTLIPSEPLSGPVPALARHWNELDVAALMCTGRTGPTPWLWMVRKARP